MVGMACHVGAAQRQQAGSPASNCLPHTQKAGECLEDMAGVNNNFLPDTLPVFYYMLFKANIWDLAT